MKAQNDSTDPQHIYRQLKLGVAHELVNDQNVFELIALAERDGNRLLATELREWQAPCGTHGREPGTLAPTRGFNRENVKH